MNGSTNVDATHVEALQLYVKFRLSTVNPRLLDDLRHYITDEGAPPLCCAYENLIEFALNITAELMRRGMVLVPPMGESPREYTGRAVLDDDTFALAELLRDTVFSLSQLRRMLP